MENLDWDVSFMAAQTIGLLSVLLLLAQSKIAFGHTNHVRRLATPFSSLDLVLFFVEC